MAGARHFVLLRVLAPHRGALAGFPGKLSFFSHPDPFVFLGDFVNISASRLLIDLIVILANLPHDCLSTLVYVNVSYSSFSVRIYPDNGSGLL